MNKLFAISSLVFLMALVGGGSAQAEGGGKLCVLVDACKEMQMDGYQGAMDAVFGAAMPLACETDVYAFGLVRERAGAQAELKFALRTEQSKRNPLNHVLPTCPLNEMEDSETAKTMIAQLRPYDGVIVLTKDADVSSALWAKGGIFCQVVGVPRKPQTQELERLVGSAIAEFAKYMGRQPEVSLSMPKRDYYAGEEIIVRLLGKADTANLSFGDGSGEVPIAGLAPNKGKDYSHTYTQPGTYTIRVKASLKVGRQDKESSKSFSATILPIPEPTVALTVENGTHLLGDAVKFWVTAEADSVVLDYGDGIRDQIGRCEVEHPQPKTHAYRTQGDYAVTATATLATAGRAKTKIDKERVSIVAPPPAPKPAELPKTLAPPPPSPPEINLTPVGKLYRAGIPVNVHVSGSADSVALSFGDGEKEVLPQLLSSGQDKQHVYKTAGNYTITAVANRNGREKKVEVNLDVKEPPAPDVEISGRSVKCDGEVVLPVHNEGSDVWTFHCEADAKLELSVSLSIDDASVTWELGGKDIGEGVACTLRGGLEAGPHEINVVVTSRGAEVAETWHFDVEAPGGGAGFLAALILVLIIGMGGHFIVCSVKRPKLELLYDGETVPFKWHPWYRYYAAIEVGEAAFIYCEARKKEDSWEVRLWTNVENLKFDGELPLKTRCGDDWKDYGRVSGKKISGHAVIIDEEG